MKIQKKRYDVNGSGNIIRKVAPKAFANGVEALGLMPIKITFNKGF